MWNFGNFPTQLSTTKKNGPVHEHLHLLLNGCFLFQANVQVLLGFSFGQSSPSPGAPRNLFLTKSSLLKLIKRWKFLLVQTAKMCVFSLSKKKAKVFELVLRSILRKKDLSSSTLKIVLMAEIPNNHLRCMKPYKQWNFNYQPQLLS